MKSKGFIPEDIESSMASRPYTSGFPPLERAAEESGDETKISINFFY